ncbi:hypothetical protein RSAG8_06275, partial [Rhizoctonia solani AG-8 WAC10335]
MAAPSLQPLALSQPVGTPAAEWAQETVEAIDPNASTGVVTDPSGNPTTDHSKSALAGEPGHGINAEKTAAQLEAQRFAVQPVFNSAPITHDEKTPTNDRSQPRLYTDAQGNPTTDPNTNTLLSNLGTSQPLPSATNKSLPPTPAPQLPGGWIRGPESRQHSMVIPETSLYEDVSAALGTVGQAAANVVESLRNGREANGNANATQAQAPATSTENTKPDSSIPPRSGSPGLLSRAQGMITGLLARPASPAAKLPAPDAPTTTGDAALVGGGAVANTANKLGENIAAGQDLGGHSPKGVKETEQAKLEKEGAGRVVSPDSANTASQFLNADVLTPDPTRPPKDPGLVGPLFPDTLDGGKKDNNKGSKLGSTLSPDSDVQEAASRSNQGFSVPIHGSGSPDAKSRSTPESERPQPTMTKVSDSGVIEKLMDVKDMVSAPFAGSRASQERARSTDPVSPSSPGRTTNVLSSTDQSGVNPEGIRTTAKSQTATGTDRKETTSSTGHDETTPAIGPKGPASTALQKEDSTDREENTSGVPIQGISSRGGGQGDVYASEGGVVTQRSNPAVNSTSPPGSPNKGVSRLWSRSRRSVDEGTTGAKSTRSRFTEEPSTGSDSASAPTSPSSSRFKVPLKDKIKGELKIISGKVSRNESKVEQGIALKTGQDPTSPTIHKH